MHRIRRKVKLANKRRLRVRRKLKGTAERPRLSVYRSLQHVYCQLIDDEAGKTLVSSSTVQLVKGGESIEKCGNRDAAAKIGKDIAEKAKAAGITKVVFDRGPYRYHGRVQSLADAAREGGLQF